MATYAPCPACGLMYTIDTENNKKGGFRCSANLRYDPASLALTEAV